MTKNRVVNWAMNNGALVGLIALCIALFIATPYFLTVANLLNIGIQAATVAILALSLIHISEPTRHFKRSRMPSSA